MPAAATSRRTSEAPAELRQARHAFLDDLIAGGVAQTQVAFGAESAARDGGDFFLVEKSAAEIDVLQPEAGDIREQIKRSFGELAGDPRDLVQLGVQQFPTAVERDQHRLE